MISESEQIQTEPRPVTIYALSDPRKPQLIRYIGKTTQRLRKREYSHLVDAKRDSKQNRRANWINKLTREGVRPIAWPIEICDTSNWEEREKYWIAFFKPMGCLTNYHEGGTKGFSGRPLPESTKAKLRARLLGVKWTEEQKARHRELVRKVPPTQKQIDQRKWFLANKVPYKLRMPTPEGRASLSEKAKLRRGKYSSEKHKAQFEAVIASNVGRKHSEEFSRKLSERGKLRKGKPISEKHMAQIVALGKSRVGWKMPDAQRKRMADVGRARKGKPITEAHRNQFENVRKHNHRPVRCIETGEIFPNVSAASRRAGYSWHKAVSRAIKKGKTCGGMTWEYVQSQDKI